MVREGVHHLMKGGGVVERTREQEAGPSLDLGAGPGQLGVEIERTRVAACPHEERGCAFEYETVGVPTMVQTIQESDQADGIDVPDSIDVRIVALQRRAACPAHDASDAEGVRAKEVRLQG